MGTILIKGGTIVNEGNRYRSDIYIKDGILTSVNEIFIEDPPADEVIDAAGLIILPGIIDDQVHFRQPGLENKGTIESESRAAVAGGITSFMEMPNTSPPTTCNKTWREKMTMAANKAWCNYSFYLGATNENIEELVTADKRYTCGIKVFMGASTGNLLVDDEQALENIFEKVTLPIAVHSEDEQTIRENIARFRAESEQGLPEWHPQIRSREACIRSTKRALDYANRLQGHLHLLHISTAEEVELIRNAKSKEVPVTAEVCVHHLWFSDQDYREKGNLIKWNPAVKSPVDREALWNGLVDGTLDIVATDHAPHELDSKRESYFMAPSGGPMVEHSLLAMLEMAKDGRCSIEQVVDWMAHKPAKLFRIHNRGFIRKGYHADLVIVNPQDPWKVNGNETHYLVKWSPLDGTTFHNRICSTIVNGRVVYNHGVFNTDMKSPMPLIFNR